MSPESPRNPQQDVVLRNIKNLYINGPAKNSDDKTIEQWGKLVEIEEGKAVEIGISQIDIEYAKLQGMTPSDRKYYLTTLYEDYGIKLEKGEEPEMSGEDLIELERRMQTLNSRTNL